MTSLVWWFVYYCRLVFLGLTRFMCKWKLGVPFSNPVWGRCPSAHGDSTLVDRIPIGANRLWSIAPPGPHLGNSIIVDLGVVPCMYEFRIQLLRMVHLLSIEQLPFLHEFCLCIFTSDWYFITVHRCVNLTFIFRMTWWNRSFIFLVFVCDQCECDVGPSIARRPCCFSYLCATSFHA